MVGAYLVAGVTLLGALQLAAGPEDELAFDAARLIKALELRSGSTVADIGAGDGKLSIILAREVGPTGRVYATDLKAERLQAIREAAETAGLTNISFVEGHETRTSLPEGCCDGLVVRFVYHHFADPSAMNASMRQSLRPGARLAVIDFSPRGTESAKPAGRASGKQHGLNPETVARELAEAGFELMSIEHGSEPRAFMVVVRRP